MATAEGTGKGKATGGSMPGGRRAVRVKAKAKGATGAGTTATAATAGAELATAPFFFSGADAFAGQWFLC